MKYKKCTKLPQYCGRIFNESDEEFEDGFCTCGAILEDFDPNEQVRVESEKQETPNEDEEYPEYDDSDGKTQEEPVTNNNHIEVEEGTSLINWTKTEDTYEELEDEDGPLYHITESGKLLFRGDPSFIELQRRSINSEDIYRDYTGDRVVVLYKKMVYKTIPLEFDEMIIGRESKGDFPDIDLTSIDPDRLVSRRHAMIYRGNQSYYIRNLSNKNTLKVNQEYLERNQEVKLTDQSQIVLSGKFGLIFYQENGEINE